MGLSNVYEREEFQIFGLPVNAEFSINSFDKNEYEYSIKLTGHAGDLGTVVDILENSRRPRSFVPEKVIKNGPATVVVWNDGSKTVVKRTDEDDDPEKGFAMALVKKLYGTRSRFKKMLRDKTKVQE